MLLTRNFSLEELTRSQIAITRGISNAPTHDIVGNLRMTALGLEQIKSFAGGRLIQSVSGYRCPAVNAAVGGTPTSAHLTGYAADIVAAGMTAVGLAQLIRDSRIAFDQLILETSRNVVHVSFDPRLRRQVLL